MARTAEEALKATQKARMERLNERFERAIELAIERGETSIMVTVDSDDADLVPQVIEDHESRGFTVDNDGRDIDIDWAKK